MDHYEGIRRWVVTLRHAELAAGTKGWTLEQQLTRQLAVIVPLNGSGMLESEGRRTRLEPDYAYVCHAEGTFGMTADGQSELAAVILRLDWEERKGDRCEPVAKKRLMELLPPGQAIAAEPYGKISALARSIWERCRSDDELEAWRAQLDCSELIYMLASAEAKTQIETTRHALDKAAAFMEERYGEELTVRQLAGIAGLSPKYFADLYKKTFGISAVDALTKLRIDKAKRLMLQGERLMKDIAQEVGYADPFYFSRKFKQICGISPTEYMKHRSRRIAAYGSTSVNGYLLALRIVPYAAPLHPKWSKHYYGRYGPEIAYHLDAHRQNYNKSQNIELLKKAKPELIVCGNGLESAEREELESIAPVVVLPEPEAGWQKGLSELAAALGEEAEAELWSERYRSTIAALKRQMFEAEAQPSVLPLKFLKGTFYLYMSRGMHEVLIEGLGLRAACGSVLPERPVPVSLEAIGAIDADIVLLLVCQESVTLEAWQSVKESGSWMAMRMVRDHRLRLVPSDPWREYSPIALERIAEEARKLLTANNP